MRTGSDPCPWITRIWMMDAMDAMEIPKDRMLALAKMARGEYDHRDLCGEDASDVEWLCNWAAGMMNVLVMVNALPPFKELDLGTYGRVRQVVQDTVQRFHGEARTPRNPHWSNYWADLTPS